MAASSAVARAVVARTSSELRHGLGTYVRRHSRASPLFPDRSRSAGTPESGAFGSTVRPRRAELCGPPIAGGSESGRGGFSAFRRSSVSACGRSYFAELKPWRLGGLTAGDARAAAGSAAGGAAGELSRDESGASSGWGRDECIGIGAPRAHASGGRGRKESNVAAWLGYRRGRTSDMETGAG